MAAFSGYATPLPPQTNSLQGQSQRNSLSIHTSEFELAVERLLSNVHFAQYHKTIGGLLVADPEKWKAFYILRTSPLEWVEAVCPTIPFCLPTEIWDLLVEIRTSRSWAHRRDSVIERYNQRVSVQVSPNTPKSSPSQYLAPTKYLALPSSSPSHNKRSRSGSYTSLDHSVHDQDGHVRSYSDAGLEPGTPNSIASPSPSITNINAPRTAPAGYRFVCISKHCSQNYSRLGDYENHIREKHYELLDHDPYSSLQRVAATPSQPKNAVEEPASTPPGQSAAPSLDSDTVGPETMQATGGPELQLNSDLFDPSSTLDNFQFFSGWGSTGPFLNQATMFITGNQSPIMNSFNQNLDLNDNDTQMN